MIDLALFALGLVAFLLGLWGLFLRVWILGLICALAGAFLVTAVALEWEEQTIEQGTCEPLEDGRRMCWEIRP